MVPLPAARLAAVSLLWFGWNAQWLTIPPVLVPNQVLLILGGNRAVAELAAGSVLAAGALVSLLVTPVAGALSDRAGGRTGRRRGFLVAGVAGTSLALVLLERAGQGTLLFYALAYLNLQVWWNWAAGPFAGLIPDVVPPGQRDAASGWMNALGIAGTIAGNLALLAFYDPGRPGPVLLCLGVLNLLCLAGTLAWVREAPFPAAAVPFRLRSFLRGFRLPWAGNQAFYWALAARLLTNMGVWSILVFLVFYLQFVVGLSQAQAASLMPGLLAAGAAVGIPASLAAAPLVRRFGPVRVVRGSGWVMALSAASCTLVAFSPAVLPVAATVLVFSAANGVFGAADWALALRVLPGGPDAGRSLGIWHICMVLPQMAGPLTTGAVIALAKDAVSAPFAYGLAFGLAACWLVAAACLVGRVRVAEPVYAAG